MKRSYDLTSKYQIIHRIRYTKQLIVELCLNILQTIKNGSRNIYLRSSNIIKYLELYLKYYKVVLFIIYKDYEYYGIDNLSIRQGSYSTVIRDNASDLLTNELVYIISKAFYLALEEL